MDMFTLILVVSPVCAYIQAHHTVCVKYVQFKNIK